MLPWARRHAAPKARRGVFPSQNVQTPEGRCLKRRWKLQAARLQRVKPEAQLHPAVDTFMV